ncbi:penicillin acylase [Pseudoxanthomonas kalamensis DSM 18571]|uniref:penicillin acylase family protein n=1 Tax=Pseudoxanthomonas kalamensis TaxID=289483 RepID=UPI001391FC8C|nr:penicillin acylase family protein [Pseudoxanthomonas kalamensis]KAF1708543.1 penicillin acylase [Pseudoxanthomonas kalamensis DSM 18571]
MWKWLRRIVLLLIVLLLAAVVVAWWMLRGSLPQLDGELALPGLSAPVSVQRDALGVVTVEAANETDMARVLGYVHAQERFFEMDLMRRSSAGELSELFGPVALELDKQRRVHRMRARAEASLDSFAGNRRTQLQAYVEGVNAGLAALDSRPWPYLLLRQQPRPWTMADSALTGYAMYFDLQDERNLRELALAQIRQHSPPALYALIAHDGSRWDAPLYGPPRGDAVLPGPDQLDLRTLPTPDGDPAPAIDDAGTPGSNNWAVSGALTADGRAIVADDMHLGLRAPGIWFRARLRYANTRAPGGTVDVSGFTLPGLPAVIVGSNGHVAWGFTNSYIDTADWKRIAKADLPAAGLREHVERIAVAGAEPIELRVRDTDWGPILHEDANGDALALRWVAHLPGAVRVDLADMAVAGDLDAAFAVADHAGVPVQNLMLADSQGRIGWRLIGMRPQRSGECGLPLDVPSPAVDAEAGVAPQAEPATACPDWPIHADAAPQDVDPDSHRLWTANARTLDSEALQAVGDGGYAFAARAQQIRDDLFASERFTEHDLLAIQLDDRAVFMQQWWQLLQAQPAADGSALAELAAAAKDWSGRASVDSASYRIVRAWRLAVRERIADGLTAPVRAALGEDFQMPQLGQLEGVVWPLLQQRPAHLLPRQYASWDALLEDAARATRDELAAQGPLAQRSWGERNTARICHPLSAALPLGDRLLCMPHEPLPGDAMMPRVQGPAFGASERMVVSPGHEADGIIHMPGGQSGHPLSPFWGAGHDDWVQGRATPFLPGPARYTLRFSPVR